MATLPSFLFPTSPISSDDDLGVRPATPSKGKGRALAPPPPPPSPPSIAAPYITLTGATDRAGYPVLTIHASLLPPPDACPAAAGAAVAAAIAPVAPSTPLVVVLVTHGGGGRPSAAAGRMLAATLEAARLEAPRIRALYVLGADVAWRAAAAASSWVVGGAIRAAWASTVYVDLVEDLEAALGAGIGEAMGLTWGEVVADEEHREWLGRQWVRSPATLDPSAPLMQLELVALTGAASSSSPPRPVIKSVGDFV